MSLFDDASLIITPNGYKEDKLYSIKPSDGSGDLVVTRATTATRVNSDGLIEECPYNLLQRSEEFDNSYWSKLASSIIANVTTSPSGNLTADKLVEDTSGSAHRFLSTAIATTNGVTYTGSIFLKSAGRNYAYVNLENSGGTLVAGNVDLTNGNVTQTLAGSISVIPFINGWYRIIFSGISVSTSNAFFQIRTSNSPIYANYTGDGTSGIFVWGAQVVTGTSEKEYFSTTDRLDVPRLDYTNSSCPSILVEPQRTNRFTYSNEFSNIAWVKNIGAILANNATSPEGITNASKLVGIALTTQQWIYRLSLPVVSGSQYTFSIFAKKGEYNFIQLRNLSNINANSVFNLNTGTIHSTSTGTAQIQNFGNGWYRCSVTATASSTGNSEIYVNLSTNGTSQQSFLGNGTSGVFIYGAQLEQGANSTSYISTVASTVTRNADVISKTGISSLIGQTEGTIFVDIDLEALPQSTQRFIQLKGTSFDIFIRSGVYAITGMSSITFTPIIGKMKIAATYSNNLAKLFINGIEIASRTSVVISNTNSIGIGNDSLGGNINSNINFNSAQLYKTALTDQECINLTTL